MAKTLFISDLHLSPENEHLTNLLQIFLTSHAADAEAVYILGDLFDRWIGDNLQCSFQQKISQLLYQLHQQKIPTYLMHGNRDFLVGQHFAEASGCQLITDPLSIDLYGTPTLLTHGDMLCTNDKKYQFYRRTIRPILTFLQPYVPVNLCEKIAKIMRNKSKQHTANLDTLLSDVTSSAVTELFIRSQCSLVIHGHTHRPAIHQEKIHEREVTRIVLSDWGKQGNMLVCDESGTRELVYFGC